MTGPIPLKPCPDLSDIKLLCCDVDGVMTDGGLYYLDSGEMMKKFNVLDGQGLKMVQNIGIKTAFVSQSENMSIRHRAKALKIDFCEIGIDDKLITLNEICETLAISLKQVVHIADDINDLTLLQKVGVPVTVPNGVQEVKAVCKYITQKPGGYGAVRELCETIIDSQV